MPRRLERAEQNPRSALKTAGCCFAGLFEEKATRADVDKIIHRICLLEEKVLKCYQNDRQADELSPENDLKRRQLIQKYCKDRSTSISRSRCPSSCEGKSPSKKKSSGSGSSQFGSCEPDKSAANSVESSKKPTPNSSFVKLSCGCVAKKKPKPSQHPPEISKCSSFEPEAAASGTIPKPKSPTCEPVPKPRSPTCEVIPKTRSLTCETIPKAKSHTCEGIEVCPICNDQSFGCCNNKCAEKNKQSGENSLSNSTHGNRAEPPKRVPCHKCKGIGFCKICSEQTSKCCSSKCAIASPKPCASQEISKRPSNENVYAPNNFPDSQKRVSFTNTGKRDSSVNTDESEFLEAAAYESDDNIPIKTKAVKKKHSKKKITQDSTKKEVSTFTAECEGRWVSQPGITQSTQTCVLSETSLVSPSPSENCNIYVNKTYESHCSPHSVVVSSVKENHRIHKVPNCNSNNVKLKNSDLMQIKSVMDRNMSSQSVNEPAFYVSDANISIMSSKKPSQMVECSSTQFEQRICPDDYKKKITKHKKKRLKRTISGKRLKKLPNDDDGHKPYEIVVKPVKESSCRCVSNHSNSLRRHPKFRMIKTYKQVNSTPVDHSCDLSSRAPIELNSERECCVEELKPQRPTILKSSSNEQCNIEETPPMRYKKVRIAENGTRIENN